MFDTIRREVEGAESAFVGRVAADGAWGLDLRAAMRNLQQAEASKRPVLLLGTAFSYVHLLDEMAALHLSVNLPPGSIALETGGYKGRSRSLPKAELHAFITKRLGVPASDIVCEYGMSELSSQAYQQGARSGDSPPSDLGAARRGARFGDGRFHFPPWARARVVSPETVEEVAEGETGLIRVVDLANVYSVMAIQTEDLAIRRGDGFELLGRAAQAEPRGCSLMATAL
jgi:hypothetical protein